MSGTETLFWVKAPVNACYAVLSDTAHLQEYMPACNQSIILSQHPGYTEVKLTSNMGEIIERRHLEPPFGVTWVLVRGTALKDMKGEWAIEPDQGGCILRYAVLVRPAIPLPGSLVNFFENKNLPDMVRNVRARIESGGRWAKPGSRRG